MSEIRLLANAVALDLGMLLVWRAGPLATLAGAMGLTRVHMARGLAEIAGLQEADFGWARRQLGIDRRRMERVYRAATRLAQASLAL